MVSSGIQYSRWGPDQRSSQSRTGRRRLSRLYGGRSFPLTEYNNIPAALLHTPTEFSDGRSTFVAWLSMHGVYRTSIGLYEVRTVHTPHIRMYRAHAQMQILQYVPNDAVCTDKTSSARLFHPCRCYCIWIMPRRNEALPTMLLS